MTVLSGITCHKKMMSQTVNFGRSYEANEIEAAIRCAAESMDLRYEKDVSLDTSFKPGETTPTSETSMISYDLTPASFFSRMLPSSGGMRVNYFPNSLDRVLIGGLVLKSFPQETINEFVTQLYNFLPQNE